MNLTYLLTRKDNGYIFITLIYLPPYIMPGFDGTGPEGKGPMTGRGDGPCSVKGDKKGSFGRGRFGRGRGQRDGRRAEKK